MFMRANKEYLLVSIKQTDATKTIHSVGRMQTVACGTHLMNSLTKQIQQLHESDNRIVLSVTGGGSAVIPQLLSVSGASNTILEAIVPYSAAAFRDWLGREPDNYCSRETALNMAVVAWCRASQLADDSCSNPIGVACTASLASSKPKRGDHRCWVAVQTNAATFVYSLVLAKGCRDRAGEEEVAAHLILQAILEVSGIAQPTMSLLQTTVRPQNSSSEQEQLADETVIIETEIAAPEIADVVNRRTPLVWSLRDGSLTHEIEAPKGLLSGSFNPLHHGHIGLADAAAEVLDGEVYFELPVRNAEKPPLDFFSIEDRRQHLTSRPVALTTSPLFVDKSKLFPQTTFVIGMDTAVRILDPRFYSDSIEELRESLRTIYRNGCRFLVASRLSDQGLQSLADLAEATEFGDLFSAIPPELFREDVSSTQLRKSGPKFAIES
jgi:nicotinamide mononucleotide (NMN) deamidase PncC